jgi:tetratricopeptide (TPR) repeat protein
MNERVSIFRQWAKHRMRTRLLVCLASAGTAVLVLVTCARAQIASNSFDSSDTQLHTARSLLEYGHAREAESSVRQYLVSHSTSADAHFLLGLVLFKETRAKESLAEYSEGTRYRQPSAYELEIVALDYVLLADYMDADKWLTKSLASNPNNPQGWYYLGRTKYKENRFEEAVSAFEQCLRMDPQNVKAEDNRGLSYAGLGRNDEAMAAYRRAISWEGQQISKDPGPYLDFGSLLLDLDRAQEAVGYLRTAVRIGNADAKAHMELGKAYERLEQLSQAREELENAARLAPQDPALHFLLGRVYRKLGLMEKAKSEFERSSSLNVASAKATETPHRTE